VLCVSSTTKRHGASTPRDYIHANRLQLDNEGNRRMTQPQPLNPGLPAPPAFRPAGSATIDDFGRIDMRVGRITAVEPFPAARKPAYRLTIDFGPGGTKRSSAQLPPTYPDPGLLVGRLIVAVVNFAPRNIAGFQSEVLVLGALPGDGSIPLLSVDDGAEPGDPIG
jgi:tRNA-binding protein